VEAGAIAPAVLRVRIRGGVCVPEAPCELLVHVGEPAASAQLLEAASVTPDAASARPGPATAGVLALRLVAHGPEAVTELVVTREGRSVASVALRLPLALGALRATVPLGLHDARARTRVTLSGAEAGCIVDAYRDGRLWHTSTVRDCARGVGLPILPAAGLTRLQVRRDPFDSEHAAVLSLYGRRADEPADAALATLAEAALRVDPTDELARSLRSAQRDTPADATRVIDGTVPGHGDSAAASYLLAILDEGLLSPPTAVSGLPRAELQQAAAREQHQKLGILVLALCAVALAALVHRVRAVDVVE
jgi:hypothetical protein